MRTYARAMGLAVGLALVVVPAVMTPTPPGGGGTPVVDAGPGTDGSTTADSGPSDCVMKPQTHLEIINACTDAVKITKNPTLPLLLPDGGLPPLP
jgi:hypothetical protein